MARDYNDLLADISDWLVRDMAKVAATLVFLAEDRHKRDIHIRKMIRRSITVGQDTRFLPLPKQFLQMNRLQILLGDNLGKLTQVAAEAINERTPREDTTQYCIHEELEFNTVIGAGTEVEMLYYAEFDPLSATNLTNPLLELGFGTYLYGALAESAPYLREPERIPEWEGEYDKHVEAVLESDRRSRFNAGEMRVTVQGVTP